MLMAPADSPATVTVPGSPPKAAMLSRTHSRAAHLVEEAEVRRCVGQEREPLDAEPVVDRDRDDAVAGEGGAVGHRYGAGAVDERAAVDPDEHRQAPRVRVRGPHAQVEVLVARDRGVRQQPGERRRVARHRRRRAVRDGLADAAPPWRRFRRPEAAVAHRGGGVRDPEEGDDVAGPQALHGARRGGGGDRYRCAHAVERSGRARDAQRCRAGLWTSPACGQVTADVPERPRADGVAG